ASHLAPERVALRAHVHHAEMVAVEHDQPGAGAEHGASRRREGAQRLGEALALDAEGHGRGLPAGDDETVDPAQVGDDADLARVGAEPAEHALMRLEAALESEDADHGPADHSGPAARGP